MALEPNQPIPTQQQNPAGSSPEAVRRLQEYVKALMAHRNNSAQAVGLGGIGIGLDNAARDLVAGLAGKHQDQLEMGRQGTAMQTYPDPQQDPQAALQPPTPGPGGTPSSTPFTSGPQVASAAPPHGARPTLQDEIKAVNSGTFAPTDDYQAGIDAYKDQQAKNPDLRTPPPGGLTMSGPGSDVNSVIAAVKNQPPQSQIQVAQNTQPGSPGLFAQPKAWKQDPTSMVTNFTKKLIGAGYEPETAQAIANGALGQAVGTMPQYGPPNAFGQVLSSRPGQMPVMSGPIPGFAPQPSALPGAPGVIQQQGLGPNGVPTNKIIMPQVVKPGGAGPQSNAAPQAPMAPQGGRAVVQAPPAVPSPQTASAAPITAPEATQAGMLGISPTMPTKMAMLDNQILSAVRGENTAQAQTPGITEPDEFADQKAGFDTKDPTEALALKYIDKASEEARSNPPTTIGAMGSPNMMDLLEKGDLKGVMDQPANKEAYTKALSDKLTKQADEYSKLQANYRDTAKQAVNLRPALKTALEVLNSPGFQSGPGNEIVTLGRGLREELGHLSTNMAEDAVKRGEDPGVYKKMADWALDPNNRTATANQVYTKILSGTILQSLRGMLGPNAGQFRVQELKMLEQAFGNPNLTPDANKTVMNMIDKMNDRNILMGKMSDEYSAKHGGLDSTFEKYLNLFEEKHPPYKPEEFREAIGGRPSKTPEPPKPAPAGSGFKTAPPWQK